MRFLRGFDTHDVGMKFPGLRVMRPPDLTKEGRSPPGKEERILKMAYSLYVAVPYMTTEGHSSSPSYSYDRTLIVVLVPGLAWVNGLPSRTKGHLCLTCCLWELPLYPAPWSSCRLVT